MPTGLELIRAEMARQHQDALASLTGNRDAARRLAESLRRTRRLVLLGMGGSHYVNRMVEPLYRAQGIDATALVVSEVLRAPLPAEARTVLLVSQSGRSGEIVHYLDRAIEQEHRFGMTLDADSPLAKAVPSLIGQGGPERAFAATRSLTITLALHGAVLQALGVDAAPLIDVLQKPDLPPVMAAIDALAGCKAVVYSGRGVLAGVAEVAALGLMELARMPAFAEEGGQFQHGPLEMLGEGIGVVLFRPRGPDAKAAVRLVEVSRTAGSNVVVYDASGEAPIDGAVTIAVPHREGLAAAAALFPPMQETMIGVAMKRVPNVGEPVRSTKVTDGE
jgi:fructoselysine-6-P-deglycase FrlB-like protein